MASSSGARTPRSVSDATRFTPTTPHAASKAAESSSRFQPPSSADAAARPVSSRFKDPRRPPPGSQQPPGGSGMPTPGAYINETPEQRVARLRAQHLAARNAEVTFLDKLVDRSRPILDRVHRFTVLGLIGFTAIATVVTAYAAFDMMVYNRKRKSEFIAAQKEMEESSLHAARLAYMRGDATAEQVALVEEAKAKGIDASFFSNASTPVAKQPAAAAAAATEAESSSIDMNQTGWQAVKGFLFGGLKSQDDVVAGKPRTVGSEAAAAAGGIVKTVEDKAKAAFEKERENQASGGMLDKIGTAAAAPPPERVTSSIRMSKPSSSSPASAAGGPESTTEASSPPPKKGWLW